MLKAMPRLSFSRSLFAHAFLLSALLAAQARAAGCCEGFGSMDLDGDWHSFASSQGAKTVEITNASFETSRDLFAELNRDFSLRWLHRTGYTLTIHESHGSSEAQSRAILQGAEPDFVSFDNPSAIANLAGEGKLLPVDWQTRLPANSAPYTTTVVFVVDRGNPKHIRDWSDLAAPGTSVVTPNPKTSGRGQWNYLAAWAQARQATGSDTPAREFVARLYQNVSVLNSSGRGAVETFFKKHTGDVLLLWESDAKKLAAVTDRPIEIVTPPSSLLVELPVAYLDANTQKHGTARVTVSFAKYLFNEAAQEIIARNFFRPRNPTVAEKYKRNFPSLTLLTVSDTFGSWDKAVQQHFVDGGIYDNLTAPPKISSSTPVSENSRL